MLELLKFIPILVAAIFIGNWFLSELKKAKAQSKPWYTPYLTVPGILIIIAIFLPIILKLFNDYK
ncbi:conserved hypothetical protein [Candidatus Magnetomoraceae bacterium gMMP-15]